MNVNKMINVKTICKLPFKYNDHNSRLTEELIIVFLNSNMSKLIDERLMLLLSAKGVELWIRA